MIISREGRLQYANIEEDRNRGGRFPTDAEWRGQLPSELGGWRDSYWRKISERNGRLRDERYRGQTVTQADACLRKEAARLRVLIDRIDVLEDRAWRTLRADEAFQQASVLSTAARSIVVTAGNTLLRGISASEAIRLGGYRELDARISNVLGSPVLESAEALHLASSGIYFSLNDLLNAWGSGLRTDRNALRESEANVRQTYRAFHSHAKSRGMLS